MWIVRNLLRGTLTLKGLGVSIPAKSEFDLDLALGRERAERSNQVQVAFEEGYLQTVAKSDGAAREGAGRESAEALEERLAAFKESLSRDLATLRTSLAGDVRDMLANLKVAKLKLNEEKERLLVDTTLSDAEVRARLAFLDEQERELEKNFSEIGRKRTTSVAGHGSVVENADLLAGIDR